jgi:hypothetical protein
VDDLQTIKDLKVSYRKLFDSEEGKKVLKDLSRWCRLNERTFHPDPYITANNEGARSVILYINQMRDDEQKLPEV